MADDTKKNPSDASGKATERVQQNVVKLLLEQSDSLERNRNLSQELVKAFTNLQTAAKNVNGEIVQSSAMFKEMLKDVEVRKKLESSIGNDIENQKDAMLRLKLESVRLEELREKYAASARAENVSSQSVRTDILKNEEEINKILEERSTITQEIYDIDEELSRLESISATRGIDLSKEYNSMMAKRASQYEKLNEFDEKNVEFKAFKILQGVAEARNQTIIANSVSEQVKSTEEQIKNNKEAIEQLETKLKLNKLLAASLKIQDGFFKNISQRISDSFGPLSGFTKKIGEGFGMIKDFGAKIAISLIAIELSIKAIVKSLTSGFERFKELDIAAEKFRLETGMSKEQTKELNLTVEKLSLKYAHMGVSAEELYNSSKALSDVFGRTSLISESMLEDVTKMKVNLGVSAEDSASVLATFQGIGGASEQTAMNSIKTMAVLSDKAGVSFKMVMKDIANASDDVLTTIGATPTKLAKAAIAARALGLDLNKIGSQQKRLLDFTSSITDELEASALLGRNINFMKARQLAFEGKSSESMKETLNVVKSLGDFDAMTVYQRTAIAKASGMELKDLTKALAADKVRERILHGTNSAAREKLLAQEAALEALEKEVDLTDEKYLKDKEDVLNQQKMQGVMTQLKNTMISMGVALGTILLPVFKLLGGIAEAFNAVAAGVTSLIAKIGDFGETFKGVIAASTMILLGFASYFTFSWAKNLITKNIGELITKVASVAAKNTAQAAATTASETVAATGARTVASAAAGKTAQTLSDSLPKGVAAAAREEAKLPPVGQKSRFATFMSNIHEGISKITVGDMAKITVLTAIFVASMFGLAYAMKQLDGVDWKVLGVATTAIGAFMTAAILLGDRVLAGAKGIAAFELALFGLGVALLPTALAFNVMSDALNKSKDAFVEIFKTVTVEQMLAFGLSITALGVGLAMLAPISEIAGAGLLIIAGGVLAFGYAMRILGNSSEKFGKGLAEGVLALQTLSRTNFISTFNNMRTLNEQLKVSSASMSEFVSGLFGKDALGKIGELTKMSDKLTPTADAISKMVMSFQNFQVVDNFGLAIGRLAASFTTLGTAVNAMNIEDVKMKVGEIIKATTQGQAAGTTTATSTGMDTSKLEKVFSDKLDAVVAAISKIQIQMDGKEVAKIVGKQGGAVGSPIP